jgi:hypothetical protein
MRAALIRADERALRSKSTQAPNQIDEVELARVAQRPRRAAEALRDVCAAHHANYLGVGNFAGVGSVDREKDVTHTNLRDSRVRASVRSSGPASRSAAGMDCSEENKP